MEDHQKQSLDTGVENHEQKKQAALDTVLAKAEDWEEAPIKKKILKLEGRLPKAAMREVSEQIRENEKLSGENKKNKGLQKYFKKENERIIRDAEIFYKDHKFDIPNDRFLQREMMCDIVKVMKEIKGSENYEEIDKEIDTLGMIFFDVDGLKAVNDKAEGGHSAGDLYLEKTSIVFTKGDTTKWLEEQGYKVIASHRSGDEFMCKISGESVNAVQDFKGLNGEQVNDSIIHYAMIQFKKELQEIKTKDLFDFSKQEQRDEFEELEIPSDLEFKASMSGGVASLEDALAELQRKIENGEIENIEDKDYDEILKLIVGIMFDASDKEMVKNKKEEKEGRENGTNEQKLMERIYRAGRDEASLKKEVVSLKEEMKNNKELIEQLQQERQEQNKEIERLKAQLTA